MIDARNRVSRVLQIPRSSRAFPPALLLPTAARGVRVGITLQLVGCALVAIVVDQPMSWVSGVLVTLVCVLNGIAAACDTPTTRSRVLVLAAVVVASAHAYTRADATTIGLGLGALGSLLLWAGRRVGGACLLTALQILAATLSAVMCELWGVLEMPSELLARASAVVLQALSVNAANMDSRLLIDGADALPIDYVPTWHHLFPPTIVLFLSAVAVAALAHGDRRVLARVVATCAGVCALRYVALLLWLAHDARSLFGYVLRSGDSWLVAIVVGVMALFRWRAPGVVPLTRREPDVGLFSVWAAVLTAVTFAACICGEVPTPEGRHTVRLLLDGVHSTWARWDVPVTTGSFGQASMYNSVALRRELEREYPVTVLTDGSLDDEALWHADVLVVFVPTRPFGEPEVAAIRRFVDRGGGLLLLGDHTNVFGSTVAINPLAEQFGICFRPDAVYSRRGEPLVNADPAHALPFGLRVPPVSLLTPCTLETTSRSWPLLLIRDGYSCGAVYSEDYFFTNEKMRTGPGRHGSLVVGAAARFGRGRVLALADSTFTATWALYNDPHRLELVRSSVRWLGRHASVPSLLPGWSILGVGALLMWAMVCLARTARVAWAAGAIAVGWGLAQGGVALLEVATTARAPDRSHDDRVVFVDRYVGACYADLDLAPHTPDYLTFMLCTVRLGSRPLLDAQPPDDPRLVRLVVVVEPQVPPKPAWRARLVRYVAKGGRLLVLLPGGNLMGVPEGEEARVAANAILAPFGVAVHANSRRLGSSQGAARGDPPRQESSLLVGGEAWHPCGEGQARGVATRYGQGWCGVLMGAPLFRTHQLGHPTAWPTPAQLRHLQWAVDVLRASLAVRPQRGHDMVTTDLTCLRWQTPACRIGIRGRPFALVMIQSMGGRARNGTALCMGGRRPGLRRSRAPPQA